MKAIKMLALAALAALMAMAFVGASSAMAKSTSLCKYDAEGEECAEIVHKNEKEEVTDILTTVSHVHETTLSGAKATLLNGISNVLCDVLYLGDVSKNGKGDYLGEPLIIVGNFTYTNCVDEKPNSCTVTEVSASSTIEVLRTEHEKATVTGEGEVKVVCSGISCTYKGEGLEGHALGPLLSSEANGSVSINEQTTNKVKGLLCPTTAKLDITVTPLSATYIAS